jgi:hypothetical protein
MMLNQLLLNTHSLFIFSQVQTHFENQFTQLQNFLKATFAFYHAEIKMQNSRLSSLKTKPYCFTETNCLHPSPLRTGDGMILGNQAFCCFKDPVRLCSETFTSDWLKLKAYVILNFYMDQSIISLIIIGYQVAITL